MFTVKYDVHSFLFFTYRDIQNKRLQSGICAKNFESTLPVLYTFLILRKIFNINLCMNFSIIYRAAEKNSNNLTFSKE